MISLCVAWFWVCEVPVRLPRAVSCGDPAVLQWEWLSLMLPFGFTFFLIIFFCFVYFACFLYVFQLWSLRAPLNHLYFQSLFSPLLAQSCHRGRFSCLKIKGLCWGVESCGQTSLGLKFQWRLLIDTALRLSWIWPCPWSKEASSLECAELGKSQVPAQLHVHEHLGSTCGTEWVQLSSGIEKLFVLLPGTSTLNTEYLTWIFSFLIFLPLIQPY